MSQNLSSLMEFSISPLGSGESVSPAVAQALRIVKKSGLPHELHSMGTIVEGELPELLKLVEACSRELLAAGSKRLSIAVKIDVRPGGKDRLKSKVTAVEKLLKT